MPVLTRWRRLITTGEEAAAAAVADAEGNLIQCTGTVQNLDTAGWGPRAVISCMDALESPL